MNDWRAQGACRGKPPHWWFPVVESGNFTAEAFDQQQRALAICATCPVLLDCRQWGIAHENEGIWGGTTIKQRKTLRRKLGIRLNEPAADDDSWKPARAAFLFRQGWTAGQIATELRANTRQIHRWLTAEGIDAYPPPMDEPHAGDTRPHRESA